MRPRITDDRLPHGDADASRTPGVKILSLPGEPLRLLGFDPAEAGSLTRDEMAAALAEVVRIRALPNERDPVEPPPWLTVAQAAQRAQCGPKTIYREVHAGKLRAARVGGRRDLRFRAAWIDEWLERSSRPVDVTPSVREVL